MRAEILEAGGAPLWDRVMDELRERHLGIARPPGSGSVLVELRDADESACARQSLDGTR